MTVYIRGPRLVGKKRPNGCASRNLETVRQGNMQEIIKAENTKSDTEQKTTGQYDILQAASAHSIKRNGSAT